MLEKEIKEFVIFKIDFTGHLFWNGPGGWMYGRGREKGGGKFRHKDNLQIFFLRLQSNEEKQRQLDV